MKILCDAEIVRGRKVGKWIYYSLDCQGISALRAMMDVSLDEAAVPEKGDCAGEGIAC